MKKYRLLIYILSCFIIGFVFTYLVYIGLWTRLIDGFSNVPFWLYLLLIPIVFYITLTLHELGHLIAFRVQGIRIRALYLTVFVFYKDEKSWHFKFVPKLWVLFGGLVVPDLPQIKNEEEMNQVVKKFAISLMAAPIVTISVMSLSILVFFFTWVFSSFVLWFGIITIFMIYTTLLSILYIYTFKLNTKHLYGDFVAYRKMKDDPLFQFAEIYQYLSFSLSEDHHSYIYQKAQSLIEAQPKLNHQIFLIVTIMAYLDGVIHQHFPNSDTIYQRLSSLPIKRFVTSEEGLTLVYNLAEYEYFLGHVENAYQIVDVAAKQAGKRIPIKMKDYLKNRTEHVLHIAYHDEFLNDNENIYIGQGWLFEAISDPYEAAKKEHKKLPFQIYACDIPEVNEKMPSED